MSIRIGDDGTIYQNDEVIESNSAIIREDGTIEMGSLASPPQPYYANLSVAHTVPISPLERGNSGSPMQSLPDANTANEAATPARSNTAVVSRIAELEYDIRMAESKKKGHSPTKYWIIAGVCLVISPFFSLTLIGVIAAVISALKNGAMAADAERERKKLQEELDSLQH